jgi:hypothetical protein
MKRSTTFYLSFFLTIFTLSSYAQNPTIIGNSILCPDDSAVLTTQPYDTYQWFQRYFGSSTITPIAVATGQTLTVDYNNYAASYVSVEVTLGTNDWVSPEFFIDGYAFAGMTVMSTGNYTTGTNGEFVICQGDTMYFELMMPYNTNITWYRDGNPIAGATGIILTVTEPGNYFVTGAPADCPNFISNPGVTLEVIDCVNGIDDPALSLPVKTYPNPATNIISISNLKANTSYVLLNSLGQRIREGITTSAEIKMNVSDLTDGVYFLKMANGQRAQFLKTSK